jgi:glutathione synthase/RimK-type ligase-like ATP-grasp enzyme
MERVPTSDWRANVELGAEGKPIAIDDDIRSIVAEAGERIGTKVCAVDLFRWQGALLIGEVNHSPMFKGIVEATEIDVATLIASSVLGIPAP